MYTPWWNGILFKNINILTPSFTWKRLLFQQHFSITGFYLRWKQRERNFQSGPLRCVGDQRLGLQLGSLCESPGVLMQRVGLQCDSVPVLSTNPQAGAGIKECPCFTPGAHPYVQSQPLPLHTTYYRSNLSQDKERLWGQLSPPILTSSHSALQFCDSAGMIKSHFSFSQSLTLVINSIGCAETADGGFLLAFLSKSETSSPGLPSFSCSLLVWISTLKIKCPFPHHGSPKVTI